MRTTLDIDDSVLLAAKAIARDRGVSIGSALSLLARRGLDEGSHTSRSNGFPVFAVSGSSSPITLDVVLDHRDD